MIRFSNLEASAVDLRATWASSEPFECVVIDELCEPNSLRAAVASIDNRVATLRRSSDYVFAREKYEHPGFGDSSAELAALREDLVSERFSKLLQSITGLDVFVDPDFHGGGMHSGGRGSFLDMHADFNTHPQHPGWVRELNILLYLNDGWLPGFGGELLLRHKETGVERTIKPVFNRCVIMLTKAHTLHGYREISFPDGMYRRSIASYAYSLGAGEAPTHRSTTWYPKDGRGKQLLGRAWPKLVALKTRFFGSATARNRSGQR